jgi:hypothetical protein
MRFGQEAAASLPGLSTSGGNSGQLEPIFAAVGLQRMRLHLDQQVPE